MQKRNSSIGHFLWSGCALILILVPFHALLTAWFASHFGHFDLIRLWKEIILLVLVLVSKYLVIRNPPMRRQLLRSRVVQLSLAFIGLCILMTAYGLLRGSVGMSAALYGLIIDTRPFVFLLVIMVASKAAPLPRRYLRWIVVPAVLVIGFGLLQQFILPADVLKHVGYGPHTLPAFQPVDNKPAFARVQSSLRGPNPLGAYLVPVLMTVVAMAAAHKKRRFALIGLFMAGYVVLLGSYSRSALIGLFMALGIFAYLSLKSRASKQIFGFVMVLLVVVAGVAVIALRHNSNFENIAFHTDEHSLSPRSSNQDRLSALTGGLNDIIKHPLGNGVGSAGPASLRNTHSPGRIAENYFLQIGQEMGIAGLILFVAALGAITQALWQKRSDRLARAMLAALVGLNFVNLVSHAWADDTLAYVFFGMIGFVIAKTSTKSENPATLEHKHI